MKREQIIEVLKKRKVDFNLQKYESNEIDTAIEIIKRLVPPDYLASELSDNPSKERQIIEKKDELIDAWSAYGTHVAIMWNKDLEDDESKDLKLWLWENIKRIRDELSTLKSQISEPERLTDIGQQYHLTCERCGDIFWSVEAFPKPQLCNDCSELEPKQPSSLLKESGGKLNKTAEAQLKDVGQVRSAEEVLKTKLIFDRKEDLWVGEVLAAMHEFASQFQEQPITDSPKEILQHYEICKSINSLDNCGRTYEDIIDQYLSEFPVSKFPLSLKAQKPSDEDIFKWADSEYGCSGSQAPIARREVNIAIKAAKAMRDGLIPAKDKD